MKMVLGGLVLLVAASVIGGAGCATGPTPREKLLKRAAFDLNCTQDELSVTKLDGRTRGVRGCGHQATYIESCDGPPGNVMRRCTWVMNTETKVSAD